MSTKPISTSDPSVPSPIQNKQLKELTRPESQVNNYISQNQPQSFNKQKPDKLNSHTATQFGRKIENLDAEKLAEVIQLKGFSEFLKEFGLAVNIFDRETKSVISTHKDINSLSEFLIEKDLSFQPNDNKYDILLSKGDKLIVEQDFVDRNPEIKNSESFSEKYIVISHSTTFSITHFLQDLIFNDIRKLYIKEKKVTREEKVEKTEKLPSEMKRSNTGKAPQKKEPEEVATEIKKYLFENPTFSNNISVSEITIQRLEKKRKEKQEEEKTAKDRKDVRHGEEKKQIEMHNQLNKI